MTGGGGRRLRVAVVGVGNTLAGDDGVGPHVVKLLRSGWEGDERVLLMEMEGDLYGVAEVVPRTERLLFVDAVAGVSVGKIVEGSTAPRAAAPSLHQTDITTVMEQLRQLELCDPFPDWEVLGVVVQPPFSLGEGLSPRVETAAKELAAMVERRIRSVIGSVENGSSQPLRSTEDRRGVPSGSENH